MHHSVGLVVEGVAAAGEVEVAVVLVLERVVVVTMQGQ